MTESPMHFKPIVLACAALLAAAVPAQAALTLEWWHGSTAANAFNPTTGGTPASLVVLRDYSFTTTGTQKITSLIFCFNRRKANHQLSTARSRCGRGAHVRPMGLADLRGPLQL